MTNWRKFAEKLDGAYKAMTYHSLDRLQGHNLLLNQVYTENINKDLIIISFGNSCLKSKRKRKNHRKKQKNQERSFGIG
jgi:hypothetical protein